MEMSCLGRAARDKGQKRVPEPPARITIYTVAPYRTFVPNAQFLNQVAGLGLPDTFFADDVDQDAYATAVTASGVPKEIREYARGFTQHDPILQKRCIPISGAVEAMHQLAALGKLIYVTIRLPYSETLTRDWLARFGFPNSQECYRL